MKIAREKEKKEKKLPTLAYMLPSWGDR